MSRQLGFFSSTCQVAQWGCIWGSGDGDVQWSLVRARSHVLYVSWVVGQRLSACFPRPRGSFMLQSCQQSLAEKSYAAQVLFFASLGISPGWSYMDVFRGFCKKTQSSKAQLKEGKHEMLH